MPSVVFTKRISGIGTFTLIREDGTYTDGTEFVVHRLNMRIVKDIAGLFDLGPHVKANAIADISRAWHKCKESNRSLPNMHSVNLQYNGRPLTTVSLDREYA